VKLDQIKIANIKNGKVYKLMKEGKDLISYAYLDKIGLVKDISRIGKELNYFIDIASDIQIKSERFQQNLMIGMLKIMDAAVNLDIKSEELTKTKY
jgi:hypothetical protein